MKNQVDGHRNLYKDNQSGVVVNRNGTDRDRYRVAKKQALTNLDSTSEISELKKEVKELSRLAGEIDEIKDLLKQLLGK